MMAIENGVKFKEWKIKAKSCLIQKNAKKYKTTSVWVIEWNYFKSGDLSVGNHFLTEIFRKRGHHWAWECRTHSGLSDRRLAERLHSKHEVEEGIRLVRGGARGQGWRDTHEYRWGIEKAEIITGDNWPGSIMSKSEKKEVKIWPKTKKNLFGANRRIALRDTREYRGGDRNGSNNSQ